MSKRKKLLGKAVEHLLEAESAIDDVHDMDWDEWSLSRNGDNNNDGSAKLYKRQRRMTALSGLVYELRQLLEQEL